MVVKLGTTCCLHLSPPFGTYSPLFTTLSPSRRCRPASPLVCLADGTVFLGSGATKLFRSRSLGDSQLIRRTTSCSSSASDGSFFFDDSDDDDEFAEKLRELAARMEEERSRLGGRAEEEEEEDVDVSGEMIAAAFSSRGAADDSSSSLTPPKHSESFFDVAPPKWVAVPRMLPDWQQSVMGSAMVTSSRSVSEPSMPAAIIPRKKPPPQQSQADGSDDIGGGTGVTSTGEITASCSVKRAFSSLVFIIRELHSHTFQLRELLFREELRLDWVLGKAQAEVHASFCWLFQHIFSCTPTLMVSVMLLLANFTVYSMAAGGGVAVAATTASALQAPVVSVDYSLDLQEVVDQSKQKQQHEEMVSRKSNVSGGGTSSIKTFPLGLSSPAVTPGGGDNGGGRSSRPVAGATDDNSHNNNGAHSSRYLAEEEARAWRGIQDEATRMQSESRPESLMDPDTLRHLVAPVSLPDLGSAASSCSSADGLVTEYMRTELEYRMAVESSPDNPLLLANYAQFLFLVARDHDRAEHYFKRAAAVQPRDAESLVRYADFLWLARNDICAAEETYLEAMEADPGNACHAASYAHFLWNTGGEDTCFPLGDDQNCQQDDDGGLEDGWGGDGV